MTLLLTRSQTAALLDVPTVVAELRGAWREPPVRGLRRTVPVGQGVAHVVAGTAVTTGGARFTLKCNVWMGGVPRGTISLVDAVSGDLLAVMDSAVVTGVRTAALTVLAIEHLAVPGSIRLGIVGAGRQGVRQAAAVSQLLDVDRVTFWDVDRTRAVDAAAGLEGVRADVARDAAHLAAACDVIITVTTARSPVVQRADVRPGTTIIAIGADAPGKQELDAGLLAGARVVVDDLEQCAGQGELQHALAAGLMSTGDVAATLADVVAGRAAGRVSADEIVVVDTTGTAAQDVAAAQVAYARALAATVGTTVDFAS